jgi:hypothetical protein
MHLAVTALLSIFGALLGIAGAQRRLPVTTASIPSSNLAQYQYKRCPLLLKLHPPSATGPSTSWMHIVPKIDKGWMISHHSTWRLLMQAQY